MATVVLNQYKGKFPSGGEESVVAESLIKAATILTDELTGTEPSFIQKTSSGIKVDQPRLNLQFETIVTPLDAITAGCTAAPPSYVVLEGTKVIFSARAGEGWLFSKWTKNGVDIVGATSAVMEIAVTDDDALTNEVITYAAVFELNP